MDCSQQTAEGDEEKCFKARYMAVFVGFMADFSLYFYRVTMSVGIVAMVKSSRLTNETENIITQSCIHLIEKNQTEELTEHMGGEFDWSPEMQGYILGSSFLSYIIAMPFLSKLTEIYGCKTMLLHSIFFSALFTLLSPFAARWSVYALIAIQALRGISQGGILPSEAILIANWCPKQERGWSYTIAVCGSSVGALVGSYLTGVLCECAFLNGWRSAFYVNGSLGIILCIFILFFFYDNPSVHPKISQAELQYILSNQENVLTKKRPKTPWRKLFTSIRVYALSYALFGSLWGNAHFVTVQPTFLKTILHYSVEQDGLFSGLPFLLQIFTSQLGAFLSTLLINKNFISIDKMRKFWTFFSSFGYSACVLGIYFAGCDRTLNIIFSLSALSFVGFGFAGCWIVSADMSPTFAGTISGIATSIGSISFFLVPVVVGYLTKDAQTIEQWHKMFFISIMIVLSSGVLFAIFGSAEVQSWNDVDDETSQERKQETEVRY